MPTKIESNIMKSYFLLNIIIIKSFATYFSIYSKLELCVTLFLLKNLIPLKNEFC